MRFFGRKGEGEGEGGFDGVYSLSLVHFLFMILLFFNFSTSLFSLSYDTPFLRVL